MAQKSSNSTHFAERVVASGRPPLLRRRVILTAISFFGISLSLFLGYVFLERERQLAEMQFHSHAKDRIQSLRSALSNRFALLKFVSSFYAGSDEVERREFLSYTKEALHDHTDIEFLAWLPRIPDRDREDFERQMQADGFADARIRDYSEGKTKVAADRKEYYPLTFLEPQKKYRRLFGIDMATEESVRLAIERVMANRRPTMVPCTIPGEDGRPVKALCLFEYAESAPPSPNEPRVLRRLNAGVVASAIQLRTLLEEVIEPMSLVGVNMYFYEESSGKPSLLLARPSRAEKKPLPSIEQPPERDEDGAYLARITVADRSWIVYCTASDYFRQTSISWTPILAVLVGLLITGVMAAFCYLLIGRTEQIEKLARQRTDALIASEDRFRRLVDGAGDSFFLIDETGKLCDVNRCACESLEYSREELLGMSVPDVQMQPLRRDDGEPYWKFPKLSEPITYEGVHRKKNGETFPVEVRLTFLEHDGESWCLALCRDITERKRAESALLEEQRLLRQLLDLMENDRKLVAYEIHDGLAQQLTGLLMQLQAMQAAHDRDPSGDELAKLPKIVDLLSDSMLEVRRLIGGLRPPVLDELGVVPAVEYLVEEKQHATEAKISFKHEVRFQHLAAPLESAIYRIVQESLTNACRYSKSENVSVHLRIQDWGVGFDPEKLNGNRFGLRGIRERARLLGGNAEIVSQPDAGTVVSVVLPLLLRPLDE
jgi:PAS domain S-box-containing protein